MSQLFGVFSTTGEPFSAELLLPVLFNASRLPGQEQGEVRKWSTDRFAIFQHRAISITGSQFDVSPTTISDFVICGFIRLDNSSELRELLNYPKNSDSSSSQLVIDAYRVWGQDCTKRMLGDFAFVIFNKVSEEIFMGRDSFGTGQIFFKQQAGLFCFSSCLATLLAIRNTSRKPNLDTLALSILATHVTDGSPTAYDGIFQIPPAYNLNLTAGKWRLQQYWALEDITPVRYSTESEYFDRFEHLLNQAVKCRLQDSDQTAITLSGGIDSGTVASIAAQYFKDSGKQLGAFTAIPAYDFEGALAPNEFGNEQEFAKLTARNYENIQWRTIDSKYFSPIDGIREVVNELKHPHIAAPNCFWLVSIYRAMQAAGYNTVLSGQFGNATISWQGNLAKYYRELFFSGRIFQLSNEFRLARKQKNWPLPLAIRNLLIAPMIPQKLVKWNVARKQGTRLWETHSPLSTHFVLKRQFLEQTVETRQLHHSFLNPDFRKYTLPVGKYAASATGAALASRFGLEYRDPTTDKRLIEFCLGIPESLYIKDNLRRRLIRQSMKAKMPAEVLLNEKAGLQSADLIARLRLCRHQVTEELNYARASDLSRELLDVDRMQKVFEELLLQSDSYTRLQAGRVLMRGLMYSLFLRQFE